MRCVAREAGLTVEARPTDTQQVRLDRQREGRLGGQLPDLGIKVPDLGWPEFAAGHAA